MFAFSLSPNAAVRSYAYNGIHSQRPTKTATTAKLQHLDIVVYFGFFCKRNFLRGLLDDVRTEFELVNDTTIYIPGFQSLAQI